jgi:hypothetical protein
MDGRGRGRVGLFQIRRDMQNLQRQVENLISMLASQRIIQREVPNEKKNQGNVDHHIEHEEEHEEHEEEHEEHEEEELNHVYFEERMPKALEGRNDRIKMEVSEYAGNLKPEELIDWMKAMDRNLEW